MSFLALVILTLATYRLALLFTQEYGFAGVNSRLRDFVGVMEDLPPDQQKNVLAGILSCLWCCSLWVAIGVTLCYKLVSPDSVWFFFPFALSGGAILIDSLRIYWAERGSNLTALMEEIRDDLDGLLEGDTHA